MMLQAAILNTLCPMHAVIGPSGHITQAGPTFAKLFPDTVAVGSRFLELVEVYRPRLVTTMDELRNTAGRRLHLRLRNETRTELKGILVNDDAGGAVIKLSFGIGLVEAVRDFSLTSTDFDATDLAIEMLYLVEAKSAAMEASRTLNQRLQGAKIAAEERAFTDTLTGLRNRRAADHVLGRMGEMGDDFALLHVDLDFFKQVNDTLGHAAGDHVLQHAAKTLVERIRKEDMAARVGGDEFVLLLAGLTDRRRLSAIASRLIARLEKPIPVEGNTAGISASIGITVNRGKVRGAPDLMEEADRALYAAKRAGRAQYRFFEPGMAPLAKAD